MASSRMRRVCLIGLLVAGTVQPAAAGASQADPTGVPLLVVLADTGAKRDGLPVLTRSPDERRYLGVLERGFSGRLLRLYRCVQSLRFKRDGTPIEPAFLALTKNQGGFPRYGFFLDEVAKRDVAYIDLHFKSALSGRFGAMDQIFPHELAHVIARQLAGEPREGGANQVHAIGVRTDPQTAFNEGFAESVQVLAVDDPEAAPETRALASDVAAAQRAESWLADYGQALRARWAPAPRARMTFLLWFSQMEQVLRYHAVKANRFAFEPAIPDRLLHGPDVYRAYLLENVMPGDPTRRRKSQGRMLSTEGVVSALFARWGASPTVQTQYCEPSFYGRFGVRREEVSPLENVYLKLFHALEGARAQDAAAVVRAYREAFPGEVPAVEAILREVGLEPKWQPPVEIWLANDGFKTGTTLFDQFRGQSREHTFDLNAASLVDLMSVAGMTRAAAEAIRQGVPYTRLADVQRVPGVGRELATRLQAMEAAMRRLRAQQVEESASLGLSAILMPYAYHAALWVVMTAALAAGLYLRVRPIPWWRTALNGLVTALLGLLAAWSSDAMGGAIAWLLPVTVFGVPAALWRLAQRKPGASSARVLAAWALASLGPFVVTRAWF